MDKVLVIDDEITEDSYLGKKISRLIESEGFTVLFSQTGENGLEVIQKDLRKEIRAVLLDMEFPGQPMEGGEIFDKIKKLRSELPIVILTKRDIYTEAEEFLERGAIHYIVKRSFERRHEKLVNFLKALVEDPTNSRYTLHLRISDKACLMDIKDKNGSSMLKRRRKLTKPVREIILECVKNPDRFASFPNRYEEGIRKNQIIGLEPYENRLDIQKEVYKFNDGIKKSSNGKVHPILKGEGYHGASAFSLVIGDIKIDSPPAS